MQGYALGLVSAMLSATAGVYTEFIMKQNDDSLYWQVGFVSPSRLYVRALPQEQKENQGIHCKARHWSVTLLWNGSPQLPQPYDVTPDLRLFVHGH